MVNARVVEKFHRQSGDQRLIESFQDAPDVVTWY